MEKCVLPEYFDEVSRDDINDPGSITKRERERERISIIIVTRVDSNSNIDAVLVGTTPQIE